MTTDSARADAFAQFMEHERAMLLLTMLKTEALYYGVSRVELEDVMSDVVKGLFGEKKVLDTSRSVAGLVRRKVIWALMDRARKLARDEENGMVEVSLPDEVLEALIGTSGSRVLSETHEWKIHRHLTLEVLDQMVGQLNPAEKKLLVMRYHDGASYPLIGQATGLSAEAARKQCDRLKDRLREMVSKHLIEQGWTRHGQEPKPVDLEMIDRWFTGTCTAEDADILHQRLRSSDSFSRLFGEELLIRIIASEASIT